MQILHFYKTYITDTHGGVEQFIFQLVNSTHSLGIKSRVLTLTRAQTRGDVLHLGNHSVHRSYQNLEIASNSISWSVFSHFKELVEKVDLIHYHFPWPFMDLVHFLTRVKKPTVVTYHSDILRQQQLLKLYKPLMNRFLNHVHRIVATSPNYVESSSVLSQFSKKVSIIPIGLDKSTYPLASSESLKKWKTLLGERFFLFLGRLQYYKGLHTLVRAMEGLDYPLVIAGSGKEQLALKKQAQAAGLKNIHFLGSLSDEDKIALLTLCFAFVFPSHLRSEAFGISLLEAAMFGKPLISCEIGTGTTYINQHEKTGLVVPPNDPGALKKALTYLWHHPDEASKMGEEALQRYEKLFNAGDMAKQYEKLYRSLMV